MLKDSTGLAQEEGSPYTEKPFSEDRRLAGKTI